MRALRMGLALAIVVGCLSRQRTGRSGAARRHRAADEKNLPVRWSATENVAWKASLGGVGVSSPIVAGNRVFVTSQIGTGVSRQGPRLAQGTEPPAPAIARSPAARRRRRQVFFLVEAFNRADGRRLWEYRLEAAGPLPVGARQAQPRVAEPGHRRPARLRVVRHRPDRRARHERQARVAAPSRPGDFAVRHQLGPLELADAVSRTR